MPWLLLAIPAALLGYFLYTKSTAPSVGGAGAPPSLPQTYHIDSQTSAVGPYAIRVGDTILFTTPYDPTASMDNQTGVGYIMNQSGTSLQGSNQAYVTQGGQSATTYKAVTSGTTTLQAWSEDFSNYGKTAPASAVFTFNVS